MTVSVIPGIDAAPTRHARLLAWVDEVAELTQPDRVEWCDGSDGGVAPAHRPARRRRARSSGSTRRRSRTRSGARPTRPTSPGSRTAPSSARSTRRDAGPTNNWMAPDEMKARHDRAVPRLHARPHDVRHPVLHGPARRRDADVRRRDHRLAVRRGVDAHHDPDGDAGLERMGDDADFVPALHSRRRAAGAGARPTCRGRATRRSTSPTSPRSGPSGRTAPATAATRCSARSATRCGSPA